MLLKLTGILSVLRHETRKYINNTYILQDITNLYKYPERTREERATMEKALRKSESIFARYYLNETFNDITFDFELRDDIKIGQDFTVVS